MTEEELTEEYVEGLCKTCTVHTCRHNILKTCAIKESVKQAYLAGVKAGRPQWHKVADGNLPSDRHGHVVINQDWDKVTIRNGRFEYLDGDKADVIAWKEIVLPELKESK